MVKRFKKIRNMSRRRKIATVLAVILILVISIIVGISYNAALTLTNPTRDRIDTDPGEHGLNYTEIDFESADGLHLEGWLINGSGIRANHTIILCHGYGANKEQMLPYAEFLEQYGFSTFLFDFRAHGESEGDQCTISHREVKDALGAIKYLKSKGIQSLGMLGLSMGAATAVGTAAGCDEVVAVVADSCFSNAEEVTKNSFTHFSGLPAWPFAPITKYFMEGMIGTDADSISPEKDARARENCPLFVISGKKDDIAPPDNGRAVYDNARGPKELWIIDDAAHVQGLEVEGQEYENRVLNFFNEHMVGDQTALQR